MYYSKGLPNPLLKPDGTLVKDVQEWEAQKAYLRGVVQEHMYGTWPGKAEKVEALSVTTEDAFNGTAILEKVELAVTYGGTTFTMDVRIHRPKDHEKHPTIINNGITYDPSFQLQNPYQPEVAKRGYVLATFLMADIVPDYQLRQYYPTLPVDGSKIRPKLPCRTIMAWAWGHSVVADYIETRDFAGPLIATGASRGGKAALCAAIFDERFVVAAPTISGCGGTGAARFCGTIDGSRQDSVRCETIGRVGEVFPDWFTDQYVSYGTHEEPFAIGDEVNHFPLDANILRALVAPRAVINSDGEEDHWSNPFGTQLAWMAAQPVFDLLGVPEKNAFNLRKGVHALDALDWIAMLAFCDQLFGKECPEPCETLNQPYFKDIDISKYAEWMK